MHAANEATVQPLTALVRREWTKFRSRGRQIAMAAAMLTIILLGVVFAAIPTSSCSEGPVEVACSTDPVGPHGHSVSDTFYLVHRPLGENGSITARLTSMTGIITYPPPDHDEIVPGLVPWAKGRPHRQGRHRTRFLLCGAHGHRRSRRSYAVRIRARCGRQSKRRQR
ncbi:hypothetical protein [Nonomuraea dietziae]|uniref:hypothetical protein n=1 Tax=Nonomuraea dietziae TaxID=65515 RepID=UPI0031D0F4A6